jgi:hypothetical protein
MKYELNQYIIFFFGAKDLHEIFFMLDNNLKFWYEKMED